MEILVISRFFVARIVTTDIRTAVGFLRKRPEGMFRIFVLLAILSNFYHKKVCKYFSHVSYWKFSFTA